MADGNSPPPDPRHTHSAALWQPREAAEVEKSVAQYSRFVSRMKIALPIIAGVILLLVLVLPEMRSESDRFRIGIKNVTDVTTNALSMVNAHYLGTDDKGEPFQVFAQAVHERPDPEPNGTKLVDLKEPRAELNTNEGALGKLNATTGVYDRGDDILDLAGKVDLYRDQNYEMHTSAARVHLKENVATGTVPVTAKGPFGDIQASGFTARQNDHVLLFTGPATLVLKHKKSGNDGSTETQP
jgi:lipopolysaccharide export system protein LptC